MGTAQQTAEGETAPAAGRRSMASIKYNTWRAGEGAELIGKGHNSPQTWPACRAKTERHGKWKLTPEAACIHYNNSFVISMGDFLPFRAI